MGLVWYKEGSLLLIVLLLIKNIWLEPRKEILFPFSVIFSYLKKDFLD